MGFFRNFFTSLLGLNRRNDYLPSSRSLKECMHQITEAGRLAGPVTFARLKRQDGDGLYYLDLEARTKTAGYNLLVLGSGYL